jgi:hypothetical protein
MPDIFNPIATEGSFLASLIYQAASVLPKEEMNKILASAEKNAGRYEVILTLNGVELSAFEVIKWLERAFVSCVDEAAAAQVRDRVQDRLEKVTDLLLAFQDDLTNAITPLRTEKP